MVLLACAAVAREELDEKLEAGLLLAWKDFRKRARFILQNHSTLKCTKKPDWQDEDIKISVLVKYREGNQRRYGTQYLKLRELIRLARNDTVEKIYASRKHKYSNDESLKMVGINEEVNNSLKRIHGINDGKGVVVGILDSGIDVNHKMFQDRIESVWDLRAHGDGWVDRQYGIVYAKNPDASLNEKNLEDFHGDIDGHGTHVAGTAAGKDDKYGGAAPGASIVVVSAGTDGFSDDDVIHGCEYIIHCAKKLGMPCVINLSLGGHTSPHDGSGPLDEAINELIEDGVIICCASGNEGSDDMHCQPVQNESGEAEITFDSKFDNQLYLNINEGFTVLNVVIDGLDEFTIQLHSPEGNSKVFNSTEKTVTVEKLNYSWSIDTVGKNDQDTHVQFEFCRNNTMLPASFKIIITSSTKRDIHAWLFAGAGYFTGDSISNEYKIASPGSAEKTITVAALQSKLKWKPSSKREARVQGELGALAPFSNPGPLRHGGEISKPDISAPGMYVVSAFSSISYRDDPIYKISDDFIAMFGTSMATPVVSGIIALMLQNDPSITKQQIMERFQQLNDNRPWDNLHGFGLAQYNENQ